MKVDIIDDEKIALDVLEGYLSTFSSENNIKMTVSRFSSPTEYLENYPYPDILILDVEMPALDGMSLAKQVRSRDDGVIILFVTNMAQYAINGYEVRALDFMLKPLSYSDFSMKFKKALRFVSERSEEIPLDVEDGVVMVRYPEIYYVEVMRNYLFYHTKDEIFKVRDTMKNACERLPTKYFFRINNGYLVNMKYVSKITDHSVRVNEDELAVSRGKKKEFLQAYLRFVGGI